MTKENKIMVVMGGSFNPPTLAHYPKKETHVPLRLQLINSTIFCFGRKKHCGII